MEKEILDLLKQMNSKLDAHTQKLDNHSLMLGEHTQILMPLEHLTQASKFEYDKMLSDIAYIKDEIVAIRRYLVYTPYRSYHCACDCSNS